MSTTIKILYISYIFILFTFEFVSPLANCPAVCKCDDYTLEVKCSEGHLGVLPITLNPSVQRLVIKNNKIKTIDSSIQFYADLSYLDLSYNHLFTIPIRTFLYQKTLQELHLNHNKIGSIQNVTFIGLTTLTILNLRGNFIEELSDSIFATLSNLEELNLGQNRINSIQSNAFDGLKNLRVLYLDDNNLNIVPSTSFRNLPKLAELFLGINSFNTIPNKAFESLMGLQRLDLSGAALFNVSRETFYGLENSLRILDLSDNRLRTIPTIELSTLIRLEELSLGQNDFDVIAEGAFTGMTNLRKIDISGSQTLKIVFAGAFSSNTNLELIILSSNKILREIQEGAFGGLPHLTHVILKDNALVTLAEGLFPWANLQTLDISENPIICDCHVLWLRHLLITKNLTQTSEQILCAAPEHLRNEQLRMLSPELLGCTITNPRRQAVIGIVVVATAATITTLLLVLYRYRRRLREILKGGFGNSALGRKEREYQKTFSEEDYMSRHMGGSIGSVLQHHHHHYPHHQLQHQQQQQQLPCSLNIHPHNLTNYSQHHHHSSVRAIPVTEL